jgi:alpha-L-rhamnosidase
MIKISTIASAVLFLTLGIAASPSRVAATALPAGFVPTALRCELRQNPLGIDRLSPSLSWICSAVSAVPRGEMQTAYQMRVASTREGLNGPACDLWDTGKVLSSESCNIVYAGKPLVSGQDAYWKVRVWNRNGQVSPWSAPAFWSMGLLRPSDWQAQWIADPTLADWYNRPRTPINCYCSNLSNGDEHPVSITLDLGAVHLVDGVNIRPARPNGLSGDFATVMYPVRFTVKAASSADFSDARVMVDQTAEDYPSPRTGDVIFKFGPLSARYVRLDVTRLGHWDANDYGVMLGPLQVFSGATDLAVGAAVTASESQETDKWGRRFLVSGAPNVQFAATPSVLDSGMQGASTSRVPLMRRDFTVDGDIARATLYASARGFYEARINGRKVGEDLLSPGFTEYDKRISYQTYDVTRLVHRGSNTVGALLGYGWYAGHMNLFDNAYFWGYFPELLAQLDITLKDGRHLVVASDGTWQSTLNGPVRGSDLLDGEACDCRLDIPGWDSPGFGALGWSPVFVQNRDSTLLCWDQCPPVRDVGEIALNNPKQVAPGVFVYDLGQEITGWCKLNVDGAAGTRIAIRYAEMAKPDGELDTANMWGIRAEDDYVLDGKGLRTLEPHFTYHGFRFVEVSGLPSAPVPGSVTAVNIRSNVALNSSFASSDATYNKEMSASRWTEANLFFDVPAGCAGRAERLSWTGDIRPCVNAALYNFDSAPLFEKYVVDLRDSQKATGQFTDICPLALFRNTYTCVGSPGWADAGVSLPWDVYVATGDKAIVSEHYQAARKFVDFILSHNPNLLWVNERGMNWGDWLSSGQATPGDIGATAFFAHDADIVSRMAFVLGRKDDGEYYRLLFLAIKKAFNRAFVASDGSIRENRVAEAPVTKDVTEIVRAKILNGRLAFTVDNDTLGGDPAVGKVKTLKMTYKIDDKVVAQEFPEQQAVDISAPSGKTMTLVSAVYGTSTSPASPDMIGVQGSYALALDFDLVDDSVRSLAVQRLRDLILLDGGHPATGFWSSVELLLALSSNGANDEAARMMNLTTVPSWGSMATYGNGTFWEAMNANVRNLSLDHWTHSACGEWLWRNVAGLSPDTDHPGYAGVIVRPRPTADDTWCRATYNSPHGPITVYWHATARVFTLDLTVPIGTRATVYIPTARPASVTEGAKPAATAPGVTFMRESGQSAVYQLVSGAYHFQAAASLVAR